jgi:hypothetical protein
MFFRVPRTGIKTPLIAKGVECMRWEVFDRRRAHPPSQHLDCITGEGHVIRFEVVERRDTTSDDDLEGSEEPESECELVLWDLSTTVLSCECI